VRLTITLGSHSSLRGQNDGCLNFVDENDEVLISGFGRRGKAKGDIPGVRFKIVKVSGVGLLALWKEKKVRNLCVLRPNCDSSPPLFTGEAPFMSSSVPTSCYPSLLGHARHVYSHALPNYANKTEKRPNIASERPRDVSEPLAQHPTCHLSTFTRNSTILLTPLRERRTPLTSSPRGAAGAQQ
jgi:hypothetical protein